MDHLPCLTGPLQLWDEGVDRAASKPSKSTVSTINIEPGWPSFTPISEKQPISSFLHPQPLLFLDLSVLQDIEYDNVPPHATCQRKDLIAVLSPFRHSHAFHVGISIQFQAFLSPGLSVSKSTSSFLFSLCPFICFGSVQIWAFGMASTTCCQFIKQPDPLFSPCNNRDLESQFWSVHVSGCLLFPSAVHLVQISIKQGVIQETGCRHPVFSGIVLGWNDAAKWKGPAEGLCVFRLRLKPDVVPPGAGDQQTSDDCFCKESEKEWFHPEKLPSWVV